MKPAVLIKSNRGNLTEREHLGFIVVSDKKEKIISRVGDDNNSPFYLRSCAKPFQALPVIASKAYKKFNFSQAELAICCASHAASEEHIEIVKSILNKIGLSEKYLKCGIHEPFDLDSKNQLIKNSLKASEVHNNCSGKHAGMLAVCVNNHWDTKSYLSFDHPLQREILNIIKKFCNISGVIESSYDNCCAPVYGIPLYKMGSGYLNLFSSAEGELIRDAFTKYPVLISGIGRLDSLIIEISQGKLISKSGAEGLCVVINIEEEKALVVKIMDSNSSARALVVIEALRQLGWLKAKDLRNEYLKILMDTKVRTLDDTVVGNIQFKFNI